MNNPAFVDIADAAQSASLSDLEQLWGDQTQIVFADEATRAHYLENDCPLLLHEETSWYQPLCA